MYLTNTLRKDGFGAQFQSVLFNLLYSEVTGNTFVYTDIIDIASITDVAENNENTLDEVVDYMCIKQNYINYDTIKNKVIVEKLDINPTLRLVEKDIDNIFRSESFLKYKRHFYKNKVNRFDSKYINVAIHIRRLSRYDKENNLYEAVRHGTSNLYYLDKMNSIRFMYEGKPLRFHIYSQGNINDFNELVADDVIFHLNEKILDTFTDLVFADILLTAVSSFSYTAALLSNNEIWYLTFWHTPLKSWKVFNY
jgi:hypothetical protein